MIRTVANYSARLKKITMNDDNRGRKQQQGWGSRVQVRKNGNHYMLPKNTRKKAHQANGYINNPTPFVLGRQLTFSRNAKTVHVELSFLKRSGTRGRRNKNIKYEVKRIIKENKLLAFT